MIGSLAVAYSYGGGGSGSTYWAVVAVVALVVIAAAGWLFIRKRGRSDRTRHPSAQPPR